MLRNGNLVLAGSAIAGIYRSTDFGNTFTAVSGTGSMVKVNDFASLGSLLIAATQFGILLSTDQGQTWTTTSVTANVRSLAVSQNVITGAGYNIIHRSADAGNSWNNVNLSPGTLEVFTLKTIGNKILAGTRLKGVLMSADDGLTWQPINQGIVDTTMNINCIEHNALDVYIGTEGAGMFRRPLSDLNITLPTALSASASTPVISVSPNPFSGDISVTSSESGIIELYNVFGQKVMQAHTTGGRMLLNAEDVPTGLCILVFTNQKGQRTSSRLIRQ